MLRGEDRESWSQNGGGGTRTRFVYYVDHLSLTERDYESYLMSGSEHESCDDKDRKRNLPLSAMSCLDELKRQ